MPLPNHHIILRQVFELEFPAVADGFALQQEIGRIVQEKLLPRIEALFDRFSNSDELIRIDRLELDLGRIPPEDLEETLIQTVLKQLEDQLEIAEISASTGVERLPVAESYFEQWLFFLEKGYRPRQAAGVPEAQLKQAVLEQLASETAAVERFRRLLRKEPAVLVRLTRQHPEPFLVHVLETLTAQSQRSLPDFLREIKQWREAARQTMQAAGTIGMAGAISSGQLAETFWQYLFQQTLKQPAAGWTADKLITEFLQYLATSAGLQQAPLLRFWREIIRYKKTPYPLLKAILERHPELLEISGVENTDKKHLAAEDQTLPSTERRQTETDRQASADDHSKTANDPLETPPSDSMLPDEQQTQQRNRTAGTDQEASDQPDSPKLLPETEPESSSKRTSKAGTEPAEATPALKITKPEETSQPLSDQTKKPTDLLTTKEQPPIKPASEPGQPINPQIITADTGDFWYVANAGVILLHPFLSPYFKTAGLVDQGNFVDEAAQQKAVHLLHFLATGQTQAPEYDLLLPRFLCGLPFETPLERFVDISAEEQAEGEKLLTAAIKHWNKLGHTSPDGLREGFLQREGKLEKREAGWYLCVEQKTIDVLLNFLPWNLSMIKLPWLPELLRVEWA